MSEKRIQRESLAAVIEVCAEIVWRTYRDAMLEQGRQVPPERMAWATLPCQDRELDREIARAVLDEGARSLWADETARGLKLEADNAALIKAIKNERDFWDREIVASPDASMRWLEGLRTASEALDAVLSTPHPGQPLLERLARMEAVCRDILNVLERSGADRPPRNAYQLEGRLIVEWMQMLRAVLDGGAPGEPNDAP